MGLMSHSEKATMKNNVIPICYATERDKPFPYNDVRIVLGFYEHNAISKATWKFVFAIDFFAPYAIILV